MGHDLLLPKRLKSGDRVALVATSWGAVHALPERYRRAIQALETLGFEPVLMPNAGGGSDGGKDWVSASIAERVADFHEAFSDPSISAVLSIIGGDHCAQMINDLDFGLIKANPKVFCGYSDTTSLLHAIHTMTGLVTFYGPALMPEFGEPDGPDREVVEHWQRVTGEPNAPGKLPAIPWQSGESRMEADPAGRNMIRRQGEPRVLLRPGKATGPLLAACLPSMLRLAGTRWWPDLDGRILVIECPEGPYDLAWADADLTQLRNIGVFDQIAGLVIGRSDNWKAAEVEGLHRLTMDATEGRGFPILAGVEVTHSAPLLTVPIGIQGTIDGFDLSIDEPAVRADL